MSYLPPNWQKKIIENLFLAAKQGKLNILKLLINIDKRTLINIKNKLKNSLLQVALKYDNFEIVNYLIKENINKNFCDLKGQNIRHLACKKLLTDKNLEIYQKLLKNDKINFLKKDIYGNLPIHYIAKNSKLLHHYLLHDYTFIGLNTKNNRDLTCVSMMNINDKYYCLAFYQLLLFGINFNCFSNSNEVFIFPQNILNCTESNTCLIIKYYTTLQHLKTPIPKKHFPSTFSFDEIVEKYSKEIKDEINLLNEIIINIQTSETLLDYLTFNRCKTILYCKNKIILELYNNVMNDFENIFHFLGSFLNVKYKRALLRKNLIEHLNLFLLQTTFIYLPFEMILKISKFLNDENLFQFYNH